MKASWTDPVFRIFNVCGLAPGATTGLGKVFAVFEQEFTLHAPERMGDQTLSFCPNGPGDMKKMVGQLPVADSKLLGKLPKSKSAFFQQGNHFLPEGHFR